MFRNIVIILAMAMSAYATTISTESTTTTQSAKITKTIDATTTMTSQNSGLCSHNNGGCSDDCDDTSGHVVCSCSSKVDWVVGADGKTCVPDIDITCDKNVVSVNLPVDSVADVIGLTPYSNDLEATPSECGFVVEEGFYRFRFDVTQCDSTAQTLGNEIKFGNAIKVLLDWSKGPDLITREGNYVNINFVCSYSNEENVTHSYWLETQKKKSLEVEGFGDFTFAFDFFKDDTYSGAYAASDFPVAFHFNESIHFEISSASNIANVELFTKTCVATPDGDLINSAISYNFMQEGCLVDPTLEEIANDDNLKNRYKMTAFRFRSNLQGLTPETRIKLECTVMVCVVGENTRCAEKCIRPETSQVDVQSSRKRRNVDVEGDLVIEHQNRILETPEHQVRSGGMFRVVGLDGRGRSLDPDELTVFGAHPNKNKDLVTVIIVLGALLSLTFGVIGIMMIRRRHRRARNIPTISGGEEMRGMVARS